MVSTDYLIDIYGDAKREERLLLERILTYPKGSIQEKKINGRLYSYLAYREGSKVRTTYIKSASEKEKLLNDINTRKDLEKKLKMVKDQLLFVENQLGRFEASLAHIKYSISTIIQEESVPVEKVLLFGSRATNTHRNDSDVDLLITFKPDAKITLLTISHLRNRFSDMLGLDVDLVEYPLPQGSILEIGNTEVVYAA